VLFPVVLKSKSPVNHPQNLLKPPSLVSQMAWHYTPFPNYQKIHETGCLLPMRPSHGDLNDRRVILFITADYARHWRDVAGHHSAQACGFWVRIGYSGDLFPIAKFPAVLSQTPAVFSTEEVANAGCHPALSADLNARFAETARHVRASFRPIKFEEFAAVEVSEDDGETWRRIWDNPDAPRRFPSLLN